jgi:hypothetical protein
MHIKTLLIIGILLACSPLFSQEKYTEFVINKEIIEVNFNGKVKFEDLVQLKSELKNVGITLEYKELKFNDQNRLQDISFIVVSESGFSGSAKKRQLTNDDTIGFYSYSQGKGGFGTGDVKIGSKD